MTDFRRLIEVLADAGVEFIVVGGVAAAAHGAVRATLDLDVVYRRTRDNLQRLVKALPNYTRIPGEHPRGCPSFGTNAPCRTG